MKPAYEQSKEKGEGDTMNVNQATNLIIVILLFTAMGGLQKEGIDFIWCAVACAITGTIIVTVAEYLQEKIGDMINED